jgi:hypothetical protein
MRQRGQGSLVRQGPPWTCSICGAVILFAADLDAHRVLPVALGGPAGPVAPAHARCNRSQGARVG